MVKFSYFGTTKCNKCKKEIDNWSYNCNHGLCDSCYNFRAIKAAIICCFIAYIVLLPFSIIQFDYEIQKCENFKSGVSSYDFDKKIELDAGINEKCYYLKNHPLAFFEYLTAIFPVALLVGVLYYALFLFVFKPKFKEVKT